MELLTDQNILGNPFDQFRIWFDEAKAALPIEEAEAACVSTVDGEGYPDGRILLMKEFTPEGVVFYTNIKSAKGVELMALPKAALTFHWTKLDRQVRIQGDVSKVDKKRADAYFATRPRMSQISSWVSQQSHPVTDRSAMEARVKEFEAKFKGKKVPAPPEWNGFCVSPRRIEFWQKRPDRLHDRFLFVKKGKNWELSRLYP